MVNVAVTGAAGDVGNEAMKALDSQTLTPITHRAHDDMDSVVLDITNIDALRDAFECQDVVVHLAADASPNASWESVDEVNINGTYNVFEAADNAGVERVVYASSHHVVHMQNTSDPTRAGTTKASPAVKSPSSVPQPDSYYAVSKIAGESLGAYYANRHGMDVVALRIGWLMSETDLQERRDDEAARTRHARANWLSPRDCRDALRKAVTVDLPESPLTANVISQNDARYLTLTESLRKLDYRPRDNAAEVLDRTD
jgi:L-arabinose 1-dehydrogenase [NAD(P)+]